MSTTAAPILPVLDGMKKIKKRTKKCIAAMKTRVQEIEIQEAALKKEREELEAQIHVADHFLVDLAETEAAFR